MRNEIVIGFLLTALLTGCAGQMPLKPQPVRHLHSPAAVVGEVPAPVTPLPPLPETTGHPSSKRFSAVVTDVPVRRFLFALARDAQLNLDLAPGVEGKVTLNAIDQTLEQILARIADQLGLRYQLQGHYLKIGPDAPYFEHYPIPYVNIVRDSVNQVSVSNKIGGENGKQGGEESDNGSATQVASQSKNHFWERLVNNTAAILGVSPPQQNGKKAQGASPIIAHPESGLLSVKATARQHRKIRRYLNQVLRRAQRQVLIEATVVDVSLNDRYQAGVDWEAVNVKLGSDKRKIDIVQNMLGQALSGPPALTIAYAGKDLAATVKLLSEFGDTRVISSPKLMVVNNQTAVLRVVENQVYFTVEVDTNQTQGVSVTTTETTPHTVPVGFVMSVTPAIDDQDNVLLHVRPTISRITGFVKDPNPMLAQAGTESRVPQIEVQEMESMLRLHDGHIGIIGGLMQDDIARKTQGIIGLSRIPYVGPLFSYKNDQGRKSELVIFIRPTVIRSASLKGDLKNYRDFLKATSAP
ncbi:MSHA biogenesis protein MshL [Methylomarinovum caldicuralii]|uniref:MSHA biogenesis protein MshL n=1 Tax=Methylomarinovum caldicuralii TaxID=438856 RepID=A0AAU9BWD3_9GAMM|nr:pilus (MSHA type) biogenesis protein MshL [Methylomarinovum caldicuralii]BCX80470.1 MSHA biogenesis protein MshL [Methylomarinovum caldicuralii]